MIKLKQRVQFRQDKYPKRQSSPSQDDDVESGRSLPSERIDGSSECNHKLEVDTARVEEKKFFNQYRVISSLVILFAIPLLVFDLRTQSGTSNLYRFFCHFDIVWKSLLQVSIWPIMTGTFFVAITSWRGTSLASNWSKIAFVISIGTAQLTNVTVQGVYPHKMW